MRVNQFAREHNIPSSDVVARCQELGLAGIRNHMSTLDAVLLAQLRRQFPKASDVSIPSIYEDVGKVPGLCRTLAALAEYAEYLAVGARWRKERRRWILRPQNFVAFEIQPRNQQVLMTVWGVPKKHDRVADLALMRSREAYSECHLSHPGQLRSASMYIHRARELYRERWGH